MKKILLLTTILAGSLCIVKSASAQLSAGVQFNAGINIDAQPEWGPSGYDYAENYYLPDVEAYYCVPRHQFVYFDRGNWVYASSLPGRCGNYNLYSGYKVVLNGRDPWYHFNEHRIQYAPYRFRHDQVVIRDFRGGYGRGNGYGYGRPDFNNRGRDWGYRDHDRRRDWGNDDRRGGYDNDRRHDNGHGRGRGERRW